jgi:predicted DNA-binding transcriptional regulator AlpA
MNALERNELLQTCKNCRWYKSSSTEIENAKDDICSYDVISSAETFLRRRDTSNDNVIRPRDLPQFLGISRTSCWRLGNDPSSGFPQKIRLSSGAVGFFRHQLEAWLESRQTVVEG